MEREDCRPLGLTFFRERDVRRMSRGYRRAKRLFDIMISSLVTLTVLPIAYMVIGAAIKATSRGPVLFRQRRTGQRGREFTCLKFRTMVENAESDVLQSMPGDARITKVGRWLRGSHLDELPQFVNVLKGEMSVVGPRPHMVSHTAYYGKLIPGYGHRLDVRPGITGLSQALGYVGETPELRDMEDRVRLDTWYVDHGSVRLDAYVLARTAALLFLPRKCRCGRKGRGTARRDGTK